MLSTVWKLARVAWAYVWSSPMGGVGALAVLVSLCFGERVRWDRGAFVVKATGPFGSWMASRGWGGFTIGWTILLWHYENPTVLAHERVHVEQAKRWGLLFWPAYLWELAIHGYRGNRFEREAYHRAGQV